MTINNELKTQVLMVADNLIASGNFRSVDARTLQDAGIEADGRKLVAVMKSLVAEGIMFRDEEASGAWFGLIDLGIDQDEETFAAENNLIQNDQGDWVAADQDDMSDGLNASKKAAMTREDRLLQKFYETGSVGRAAMAAGWKKAQVREYLDSIGIDHGDQPTLDELPARNQNDRAVDAYVRTGSIDKAAMASGYSKSYTIILLVNKGELPATNLDASKAKKAIEKFIETADFKKAAMASGLKKWDVIALLAEEGYL